MRSPGHATQRIGLSATVRPVDEVARFVGGIHPVTVINPQERPAMDLRVVEPLENMRDLQSANVPGRAGGVGASAASAPHISGVTPAMRRLAERRGASVAGSTVGSGFAGRIRNTIRNTIRRRSPAPRGIGRADPYGR